MERWLCREEGLIEWFGVRGWNLRVWREPDVVGVDILNAGEGYIGLLRAVTVIEPGLVIPLVSDSMS